MRRYRVRWLKGAGFLVLALVVLLAVAVVTGGVPLPGQTPRREQASAPAALRPGQSVELVKGMAHTLSVPEDVRTTLGIRKAGVELTAVAQEPIRTRPLVMAGTTALDPARIMRMRARFAPAEVVAIHQVEDHRTGPTFYRELRCGDKVKKGDVLGVFSSVDVGNKKNDLIDATLQWRLDEEILKRAEKSAQAVPEIFILNARRNVLGDQNAITRAVNSLKTWNIPEQDIQAVRAEAEQISKRQGRRDQGKESRWARVELTAPDDGIMIERNVSLHEMVVDNTVNLFQIANVDRLSILANCPEDDVRSLETLTDDQRRWTVRTTGAAPLTGQIDDVGYLIDPNQHTAVVKGHIDNPHGLLRAGQFVSATVELPPPADVVEVPLDAVVEDGMQSLVFVQPDPKKHQYTLRRVQVTHRFDATAFVRSRPVPPEQRLTPEEQELGMLPREPLHPGERLLPSGVGELKAALLDLESAPSQDPRSRK